MCFEVDSTADDPAPSPVVAFTESFISGNTFSISADGDVEQFVFNTDGTGSVRFAPNPDNEVSNDDVNPITWSIDSSGRLVFTETDSSGDRYNWVLEATSLSGEVASFNVTVTTQGDSFSGSGTMQRVNDNPQPTATAAPNPTTTPSSTPTPVGAVTPTPTAAPNSTPTPQPTTSVKFTPSFVSGNTFSVNTGGDVDQFVFNSDGTGSVRFAPNPDNEFSNNDVNPIIWSIDPDGRLVFTETDGSGDQYSWVLTPTTVGNDTATFNFTVTTQGNTFVGSGSIQRAAGATPTPTPTSSPTPTIAPTPLPTGASIVSTWRASQQPGKFLMFAFLSDGTYVHAEVDNQTTSDPSGMERGTFSRDPSSGITSVATTFDQNGARGISDLDGTSNMRSTVVGDVLTLEFDEDGNGSFDSSIDFQRQISAGVLGTWLFDAGNSDFLMFIFFDDGTYVHGEVDNEPNDPPGMERGLFNRNDSTGLTAVELTFDANGARGISDLDGTNNRLRMSLDNGQLLLEFDEVGNGSFDSSLRLDRQ